MMRAFEKCEIKQRIFLLEFRTQYQLAASFLRFQEYYESPKFHGKIFSLEQFMDWYAESRRNFTYYEDWGGFNIPSRVLAPFYEGKFDPLLKKEQALLDAFQNQSGDFYIIGVAKKRTRPNAATLKHEIAHGFFSTQPDYRRDVLKLLKRIPTKAMKKKLFAMGYARHVLLDEIHAYALTDVEKLTSRPSRKFEEVCQELQKLYRRYSRMASVS